MKIGNERLVKIPSGSVLLEGMLELPKDAQGVVLFAHGSGSSRHVGVTRRVPSRSAAMGKNYDSLSLLGNVERPRK